MAVAWEAWVGCRAADTISACEEALDHLARADALQSRLASWARTVLCGAALYAPLPVDTALKRVRALAQEDRHPLSSASQRLVEGRLLGMKGETERARELVRGARQMFVEAGSLVTAGGMSMTEAELALERGDVEQAELTLRDGLDLLERIGDQAYYPTVALMLAWVLLNGQRFDEVPLLLDQARATTATDDIVNFIFIDMIEGAVLANAGRLDEAEAIGRRSVELADTTDYVYARPIAHSLFAETLALDGKQDGAMEHASIAMEILAAKGNIMLAARLRERLAAVGLDAV